MNLRRSCGMILSLMAAAGLAAGCVSTSRRHSSSVVQYLYPEAKNQVETPAVPVLALPLKVGIAFVPETEGREHHLTETDKMDLMKQISTHFKKYDYVKSIDLIPSAYLVKDGSFANLDQIRTMFGIDVIALVSYDQAQFTDEGIASITYWTLVGAYIIPGEKNDTHTMVDAAVYDIASRKMLFRAPGTNHVKSHATPVNLSEQLRRDSLESFKLASQDLIVNLDLQLDLFKDKVKESPQDYQIVRKPSYTGGSALDGAFLAMLGILGGCGVWWHRRQKLS